MKKLKLLAISGSLKSSSSNTSILNYLADLSNDSFEINIYKDLESIPAFHPEKEEGNKAVKNLRSLLKACDGLIISTPEYAFGVPGVLKNALDWCVSSGELNEKPVIAISASPLFEGGSKAMASLLLTLGALGTKMTDRSHLSIANVANKIKQAKISDEATKENLKTLLFQLIDQIKLVENNK